MLPSIQSYQLPVAADLPSGRADWQVDAPHAALLIHDMQNYFIDAFGAESPMIATVIDNIRSLRGAAEDAGIPVFYTAQPPNQDPADRGLLWDFWGPGLQKESEAGIVDALSPGATDTVLTKWRYDAFSRSDLEEILVEGGRNQLIIAGVYAHIGCLATATSAFMRDIKPFLVADAMADFTSSDHRGALTFAAARCGQVVDTDEVVGRLVSSARLAEAVGSDA
ncbi:Isochorismatase [Corynebacterium glyciniphilum AJ 3170]|uniref:Isochorismatase n=1 Tax=Corynebacterium glyciniphilum AJ 3170 TaxID=1404245 RepID=X5DPC3_9CORY|nr:isochorismatase family protein [Corynebacterium glyciniphilum]AHW63139.1 Isochorismatase [Corynebacterium glyciniphilum AJ 3170]